MWIWSVCWCVATNPAENDTRARCPCSPTVRLAFLPARSGMPRQRRRQHPPPESPCAISGGPRVECLSPSRDLLSCGTDISRVPALPLLSGPRPISWRQGLGMPRCLLRGPGAQPWYALGHSMPSRESPSSRAAHVRRAGRRAARPLLAGTGPVRSPLRRTHKPNPARCSEERVALAGRPGGARRRTRRRGPVRLGCSRGLAQARTGAVRTRAAAPWGAAPLGARHEPGTSGADCAVRAAPVRSSVAERRRRPSAVWRLTGPRPSSGPSGGLAAETAPHEPRGPGG